MKRVKLKPYQRWVTVAKFSELTGLTESYAHYRMRFQNGKPPLWREGVMWRIIPPRRIMINMQKFNEWAEHN